MVLEQQYSGHQGIIKMKTHVSQSGHWPGMENYKDKCNCSSFAPAQPAEPLILTPPAEWSFKHICMNYFNIENNLQLPMLYDYFFKHYQSSANAFINVC